MSHKQKRQAYPTQYIPALNRIFKRVNVTEGVCEMLDTLVKETVHSRNRRHWKPPHFEISSWINRNYDPSEQVIWLLKSGVSENDIWHGMDKAVSLDNSAKAILKDITITAEVRIAMRHLISDKLDHLAEEQSCEEMNDREALLALAKDEGPRISGKEPREQVHWLLQNGYEYHVLEHVLSGAREWLLIMGYSKDDMLVMSALNDVAYSAATKDTRPEDINQAPDTVMQTE